MIKPKDDLFHLIKSMSRAEKRYFKMRAAVQQSDTGNISLLLFDSYNKSKAHDEEAIRASLADRSFIRHFSASKNNLYRLILKVLYEFRSGKSPKTQASEMIRYTELLYERGLYKQAGTMLSRTRRYIEKHKLLPQMLDLLEVERSMLGNSSAPRQLELLREIADKQQEIHRLIANQNNYDILRTRLNALRKTTLNAGQLRDNREMQMLLADRLLQNETQALSDTARMQFYRIKAESAIATGQPEAALKAYVSLFRLWAARPADSRSQRESYRTDLVNQLNLCYMAQRSRETETILARIKLIRPQSVDEELKLFQDVAHVELLHYLNNGQMDRGLSLIDFISRGMNKFRDNLSATRILTLRINSALMLFFCGDYQKALPWLQLLSGHSNRELRKDIRVFTRVLTLIIHFELGNLDLFDSTLRSAKRYMKQTDSDNGFERCIVNTLPRILAIADRGMRRQLYEKLRTELRQFRIESEDYVTAGLDVVLIWASSKLGTRSITEEYLFSLKKAE